MIALIRKRAKRSGIIKKAAGLALAVIVASEASLQGNAAGQMMITSGSCEMIWAGTQDMEDVSPAVRMESVVEPEDQDREETPDPGSPEDTEEIEDTEDTDGRQEEEGKPQEPSQDPAGDPTPSPTANGETDAASAPSDDSMAMASASPSATPTGEENESTVETSVSLLSSTGATYVLRSAAALPNKNDGMTIYFDTSGNGAWNEGDNYGWSKEDEMFLHLYNDKGDKFPVSSLEPMKRTALPAQEEDGVIWEFTLTKTQADTFQYVIFQRYQSTWNNTNQQTIDGNVIPKDMDRPCFILGSNNSNGARKTGTWYDLGPLSLAKEKIYFYDMTSSLETENIEAHFAGNGNTDCVVGLEEGGYAIPEDTLLGAYATVSFFDKTGNTQIGETYHFFNDPDSANNEKGFRYDPEKSNTFYYGATEKADGTKLSFWGASPAETAISLAGKKLYFDKIYFKVPVTLDRDNKDDTDTENDTDTKDDTDIKGGADAGDVAKLQIGADTPVSLTADESDDRTYSYVFGGDATADSQTILTYLHQDGTKYHFFWDKFDLEENGETVPEGNNLVTQEYEIAKVEGTYEKGNTIYFDATFSTLSYRHSSTRMAGQGIPRSDYKGEYYDPIIYVWATINHENGHVFEMSRAQKETWEEVYKVNLPEEYTEFRFAAWSDVNNYAEAQNGDGTNEFHVSEIFRKYEDPCFYADDGDPVIYDGGNRDGYWGEVYTTRDAEKYKDNGEVVDIKEGTFERQPDCLYVDATFYDYYTDYELNGYNRDNYRGGTDGSWRNQVIFRHFNQAMSDYYRENNAEVALYTGRFAPDTDPQPFAPINETLNLYGCNGDGFIRANDGWPDTYAAAQGLVCNTLTDGELVIKGGTGALQPHFNEDFLTGNNSKNAVLGKVYHNVEFPFEASDRDGNGVKYWIFDSRNTTLAMRKDQEVYYLEKMEGIPSWSHNAGVAAGHMPGGFFPFNEGSTLAPITYNYGFGVKLELKFRLTEDGTVVDNQGNAVPITFEFSGDDDAWVFIDGKLVLDIGGNHGRAEGKLNFKEKTAWVSRTKESSGGGENSGDGGKTSSFADVIPREQNLAEHTLTMFYMERGMGDSNMMISFNYPDENQLRVEKQVDVSEVDQDFKGLFDGASIFPFTIRNQATHYGTVEARGSENHIEPEIFNDSFDSSCIYHTGENHNIFEPIGEWAGRSNVAHWRARYDNVESNYKHLRYGCIRPQGGGTMDVSQVNRYLQFCYYYDDNGTPALNHMYLSFVDGNGNEVVRTLNGNTYGSAVTKSREWSTITVDLAKFMEGEGFNWSNLKEIRFGYDYEKDFYLDDFLFKAPEQAGGLVGFITKQYEIPDYGTAKSGGLNFPENAVYTLITEAGGSSDNVIGADGMFVLGNGETALFRDQFRRGSYIFLEETRDPEVFDTTWAMYEGESAYPVTSMTEGTTVKNGAGFVNHADETGSRVDDGRTESYISAMDGDEVQIANSGYTQSRRPDEPVFVFRSYSVPDSDTGLTKLKVVYTNKVRTGSLTIKKETAEGSAPLKGEYTFRVTFTNVAGMGLESAPIVKEVRINVGSGGVMEKTIEGIPVKTEFTIEEISPDESFLFEVKADEGKPALFDPETKKVSGQIINGNIKLDFYNMLKPAIHIPFEKQWIDAGGEAMTDETHALPDTLTIRLQRRIQNSGDEWETVTDVVLGEGYDRSWEYLFSNLDKYEEDPDTGVKNLWEYRIVELTDEGEAVPEGGLLKEFQAFYPEEPAVAGNPDSDDDRNEEYPYQITNIHTVSLRIEKKDAAGNLLDNVTFQLQRRNQSGEWIPVEVTTETYDSESTSMIVERGNTLTTGEDGTCTFANLPTGTYQLIETQTQPNLSLLADAILIEIDSKEMTYTINGVARTPKDNVISITIRNQPNLVLPPTGSMGQIPFTIGGLVICSMAVLMYIDYVRRRRKEGKAS